MAKTGRPKGYPRSGGRQPGTPNHATAEVKEAARVHGPKMIAMFAAIANNPKKPDMVRMHAGKELLDRGYGKAVQPLGSDPDEPITVIVKRFFPEGVGEENPYRGVFANESGPPPLGGEPLKGTSDE